MSDSVFGRSQVERESALLTELTELTEHHRAHSVQYDRILASLGIEKGRRFDRLADLPWLPVRMFKTHDLKSIPDDEVFKVLTSSGTTKRP